MLQVSVGDGSLSGTERSVFEINLFRTEGSDSVVQLPRIISVEPHQISSEGQDRVSLFGDFFDSLHDLSATVYVQFGSSEPVVGTVIGSTEIVCTAPSTTSSVTYSEVVQGYFVLVRVTNQVNFWSNAIQLFVEVRPQVLSVFPDAGPSCGQTILSIVGRSFLPSVDMTCLFSNGDSNASTPARWRSPELLECTSPSWAVPDGQDDISVPLAVSTSGGESGAQSVLSFRFVTPIVTWNALPRTVPAESSTNVTISGEYLSGYDLTCIIGGQEVLPEVQEDDFIQCTVPPRGLPLDRTFKVKVATSVGSSPSFYSSERFELVDADVTTVSEVFDSTSQAQAGLQPEAVVLPLVRGHQYWLDQSDASNSGHPIAFSSIPSGVHASGGEAWTKGVQRLPLSPEASASSTDGPGEGILSFLVPMDAPDVLYTYSETSPGLDHGITAIITDHVEYTSARVVATYGSACNPAPHPFRYGQFCC